MSAEPSRSFQTAATEATVQLLKAPLQASLAHRECVQQAEGLPAHRNPLRQAGAKLPGLCLPRRRSCMVDLMSLDPSSGLGEQPSSPLRVKTEVAALRRDVYFSLPTGVIQLEVACGRFETRRPVEPAGRTGNGAYLTREQNIRRSYPEGEGIYATSGGLHPSDAAQTIE